MGLCEYVQHLSIFDYVAVSASLEGRVTEYVDHLHEHFVEPVVIRRALVLAGLLWIARLALLEIAVRLHRRRPVRSAKDSPRPPGWMPLRSVGRSSLSG